MPARIPPMRELDAMGASEFAAALGPLFEGAPRFVDRIGADRPYGSYASMLERARIIASTMPEDEQIELLDSHPRIGAPPASISELSYREQGYDRPAPGAEEGDALQAQLDRLNAAYEERFGFRFVIFVAGRPRQEIGRILGASRERDREQEKQRGLRDVIAIAEDRLRHLADQESAA
jgi:2-oxo-4-hydroxy-4-carboxy--5-ureidoimidazoline (OHCU) decarboxylase